MGSPPPHGKVFKTKASKVEKNKAVFAGQDEDGKPVTITLESEYSSKVVVGGDWAVDFRTLPKDQS